MLKQPTDVRAELYAQAPAVFQALFIGQVEKLRKVNLDDIVVNPFSSAFGALAYGSSPSKEDESRSIIMHRFLGPSLSTSVANALRGLVAEVCGQPAGLSLKKRGNLVEFHYMDSISQDVHYGIIRTGPKDLNSVTAKAVDSRLEAWSEELTSRGTQHAKKQLMVGTLYGELKDLSSHFTLGSGNALKTVRVGAEFWQGLTGDPATYAVLKEIADSESRLTNPSVELEEAIQRLTAQL